MLARLDTAAGFTKVDPEALQRLRQPKLMVEVSIPVRMDDGSLKIFTGFRCRYDDTRMGGPRAGSGSIRTSIRPRSGACLLDDV